MIRRIFGVPVFLMGLILAGWIVYNVFVERLPASEGRPIAPAIITSSTFLIVGFLWMKGKRVR
jgi:hypothetical protein